MNKTYYVYRTTNNTDLEFFDGFGWSQNPHKAQCFLTKVEAIEISESREYRLDNFHSYFVESF